MKKSIKYQVLRIKYLLHSKLKLLTTTYKLQPSKGFTLIELLIYMGIVTILIGVMTEIFTSSLSVQLESESYTFLEQDERFITTRLGYDMYRAQSIVLPAAIGSSNSTLQLLIDGVTYSYALNNGALEITNNNGTDRLNSIYSNVSNLNFERVGNIGGDNTIRMSFRITSTITQRGQLQDFKDVNTALGLRPN